MCFISNFSLVVFLCVWFPLLDISTPQKIIGDVCLGLWYFSKEFPSDCLSLSLLFLAFSLPLYSPLFESVGGFSLTSFVKDRWVFVPLFAPFPLSLSHFPSLLSLEFTFVTITYLNPSSPPTYFCAPITSTMPYFDPISFPSVLLTSYLTPFSSVPPPPGP